VRLAGPSGSAADAGRLSPAAKSSPKTIGFIVCSLANRPEACPKLGVLARNAAQILTEKGRLPAIPLKIRF
jgi:hypothetical protein